MQERFSASVFVLLTIFINLTMKAFGTISLFKFASLEIKCCKGVIRLLDWLNSWER